MARKAIIAKLAAMIFLLVAALTIPTSADTTSSWTVIYSEDFSTGASGWTASDSDFYWDQAGQSYHYNIADGGNDWAYVPVPYTTGSFRLEFDWLPARTDDYSNHRFGIWGPQMSTSYYLGAYTQFAKGSSSQPREAYLSFFPNGSSGTPDPGNLRGQFDNNVLHHCVITYLAAPANSIELVLSRVADGAVITQEKFVGIGNFDGVDRLAMSSLGDNAYAPATAEGYIDNVVLRVPSTNQRPIASFTYSPTEPTSWDVVQFTDTSTDLDGTIIAWHWDFEDGTIATERNPRHRYSGPGDYEVTLRVTDDHDLQSAARQGLHVRQPFVETSRIPGGWPSSVITGDFNEDGKVDLAVCNSAGINIQLGKGDGTFTSGEQLSSLFPNSIAAADLDNDGHEDLLLTNGAMTIPPIPMPGVPSVKRFSTILTFRGRGDGTFAAWRTIRVGDSINVSLRGIAVGDFGSTYKREYLPPDGVPDLAVADCGTSLLGVPIGGNRVWLEYGNGLGDFPYETYVWATPNIWWGLSRLTQYPTQVLVTDMNADGLQDLVVSVRPNKVSLVLGRTGIPQFASAETIEVGLEPTNVATNDYDGDHALDLAVGVQTSLYTGAVCLVTHIDTTNKTYRADYIEAGSLPASVTSADFNADGNADVALVNHTARTGSSNLRVFLGNGTGGLAEDLALVVGDNPTCVISADVNNDDKPDLVVTNGGGGADINGDVVIFLNNSAH